MTSMRFQTLPWTRLLALALCVVALVVYFSFPPKPLSANEGAYKCLYGGTEFSEGAYKDHQRCGCTGSYGYWFDDTTCH